MKILVVGGTGGLGGHAAIHLAEKGHDVSIAARNPAPAGTAMADMPFLKGDYVAGDFTPDRLKGFDAIIFAAGNDPRHIPPSIDAQEHLNRANTEAVPAFMRAAREAGVKRVIQLGSFYPQAAPELEKNNFYIRSRRLACEGARAETRPGFDVISVNAPFMVGAVPGLSSMIFEPYVAWAEGKLPIPVYAPAGGHQFHVVPLAEPGARRRLAARRAGQGLSGRRRESELRGLFRAVLRRRRQCRAPRGAR